MSKILALISCVLIVIFVPAAAGSTDDARILKFYHTHTLDTLDVTYYKNGLYLLEPMEQLRVFLADWRDGHQRDIDPKLMDILWNIQTRHRQQ